MNEDYLESLIKIGELAKSIKLRQKRIQNFSTASTTDDWDGKRISKKLEDTTEELKLLKNELDYLLVNIQK
jgi:hypothetical protein